MTDCARLLEALQDGRPHSAQELYGLHMIVHSRISDLRRRGHEIRCFRTTERDRNGRPRAVYWYRLSPQPPPSDRSQDGGYGASVRGEHGAQGDPATASFPAVETPAAPARPLPQADGNPAGKEEEVVVFASAPSACGSGPRPASADHRQTIGRADLPETVEQAGTARPTVEQLELLAPTSSPRPAWA